MRTAELADLVTNTIFDYDPYIGADREEVYGEALEGLSSLEGCHEIIAELAEIISNLLA